VVFFVSLDSLFNGGIVKSVEEWAESWSANEYFFVAEMYMSMQRKFLFTRAWIACLALLLVSIESRAEVSTSLFKLDSQFVKELSPSTLNQFNHFIEEIDKTLPEKIKNSISSPIHLRFSKLDDTAEITVPECQDLKKIREEVEFSAIGLGFSQNSFLRKSPGVRVVFGQTTRTLSNGVFSYIIELNHHFIPAVFGAKVAQYTTLQTSSCGYDTPLLLLKATLLHEVGHVYDWESKSLSISSKFLKIALWHAGIFSETEKNQLTLRSPDSYENQSPAEYFAVNLEHFLLDPEYACRRPSLHRYFTSLFSEDPLASQRQCSINTRVPHSSTYLPIDLNPDRIYQVHYLLAGKGSALMSRWGHAMFRVVGCAPTRITPGPECMDDIAYHSVISFRAVLGGFNINYLDGILGRMPAEAYVFNFTDIISEYNFGEQRDLYSVPLQLSRDQIRDVIHASLSRISEYQGSYYFFTNNCSTEVIDLLKTALPESNALDKMNSWIDTPIGLMEQLIGERIVDPVQFNAEKSLYRYYFPSYIKTAQRAFKELVNLAILPKEMNIKDYLALPAEKRLDYYNTAKVNLNPTSLKVVNSAFYQLELSERDYLASYLENQIRNMLSRFSQGEQVLGMSRDVIVKIKEHLIYRSRLAPKLIAESGYGIPIHFDFDHMIHSRDYREFERTMLDLHKMVKSFFPKNFEQNEAIGKNIKFLMEDTRAQSGVSIQKDQIMKLLSVIKKP